MAAIDAYWAEVIRASRKAAREAAREAAIDAYWAEVGKVVDFDIYTKAIAASATNRTAVATTAAAVATANGANWLYSKPELSNFLNLTEQDNG
jgi:hypothetical protein